MKDDILFEKEFDDMMIFVKNAELETGGEYKEKLIDLLMMLGGKLHFFDTNFPWKNNQEFITGLYLENPDSTEICCWTARNRAYPIPRTEKIKGGGWGTALFYKNLYEHSINENKKINEIGCWCI